jgi:hypothetical protein
MKKCENFMFCKPAGVVLTGSYWVRASSQHMDIDTQVPVAIVWRIFAVKARAITCLHGYTPRKPEVTDL